MIFIKMYTVDMEHGERNIRYVYKRREADILTLTLTLFRAERSARKWNRQVVVYGLLYGKLEILVL